MTTLELPSGAVVVLTAPGTRDGDVAFYLRVLGEVGLTAQHLLSALRQGMHPEWTTLGGGDDHTVRGVFRVSTPDHG